MFVKLQNNYLRILTNSTVAQRKTNLFIEKYTILVLGNVYFYLLLTHLYFENSKFCTLF